MKVLQESDVLGRFFDDLGTLVESLQREQILARTNAAERQNLIAKIRHTIAQIRFWQPQTTDTGDQILLEIALEDLTELLQSFGLNENWIPSMRELIDRSQGNEIQRFASIGLTSPLSNAPEEHHQAYRAAVSAAFKIEKAGLKLTRAQRSNISPSTYLSFSKPTENDFEISKKGRGIYAQEHGSFPSMGRFNVRVSNHHGYGEGTEVHKNIRIDKPETGESAAVAAAERLLDLEKTHPPGSR